MHIDLYEAFEAGARIPKYNSLLEFFENGFYLTDDDRFKKFELRYSPWIRTLCAWFDDSETEWIYLLMGSQISKTTFMMGTLLYISQYMRGPVPAFWVLSTEEEAKLFVSSRLRSFLDEAGREAIKSREWKNSYFRVYNSAVKVGWASTKTSLRTRPARYIFGDECAIWKETIGYVKKRTRTFENKRKGIFATTPPEDENHHSYKDFISANFYQWWVPCLRCHEFQYLNFTNIKFSGKQGEYWNHDEVVESARYKCVSCGFEHGEDDKLQMINAGKPICVDPISFKPKDETPAKAKAMQIPAQYSIFTSWGSLASNFLDAKAGGVDSLKVFITDELAEVPRDFGESLKRHELAQYIDESRLPGPKSGYNLYTAGVDVQRNGELYYCVMGWSSGVVVSGHVLDYGIVTWRDAHGQHKWGELLDVMAKYQGVLYSVAIDSSDGWVTQDVYDFCNYAGKPYVALKDSGTQHIKIKYKQILPRTAKKYQAARAQDVLVINSDMIKDEIAAAFQRNADDSGAWSFHAETEENFLKQITNEHRKVEKRGGHMVSTWRLKYSHAPNHFFSALVYATAGMEDKRYILQVTKRQEGEKREKRSSIKVVQSGIRIS